MSLTIYFSSGLIPGLVVPLIAGARIITKLIWFNLSRKRSQVQSIIRMIPSFITWEIWLERNRRRFEDKILSPHQITWKMVNWIQECSSLVKVKIMPSHRLILDILRIQPLSCSTRKVIFTKWMRPLQGELKLNVDGAGNKQRFQA